jgi:hypothetical protein
LRKLSILGSLFAVLFFARLGFAQQGDAMFGGGTLLSSSQTGCSLLVLSNCFLSEKGGFYPSVSADVIFRKRIGFNFETAWRGSEGSYYGQPYRPIITDFNAMYQPKLGKKTGLDLMGGIGLQSTRFYGYTNTTSCIYYGACYTSNHNFLVDVGGGIRYYVWGHFFVRPEAHYYYIVNNTDIFSSNNVFRVGASIGYTIGGGPE